VRRILTIYAAERIHVVSKSKGRILDHIKKKKEDFQDGS
jgi:hypothetical protein